MHVLFFIVDDQNKRMIESHSEFDNNIEYKC